MVLERGFLWVAVLVAVPLAGSVAGGDAAPHPAANVWTQGDEKLHVPMWPATEPSTVAATHRDGAVDWVYHDAAADAIFLLQAGQGAPIKVFDEWGAGGPERRLVTLSAVWLDTGELHVYVVEARPLPVVGTNQWFGYHAWWSPAGGGFEPVDPPWLPNFWDFFTTGLRSDGAEVTLALGSFWLTDLVVGGLESGAVYTTRGGAFEAAATLSGYKVERAIPWDGDVIACGGRHHDGEVAIARRSTDWEWEPVAPSGAAMPSCDIAAAGADLKVFFYGIPLLGDGGGGRPGSGDATEYQVAHQRGGTWEVERLGTDPYRGQWLMATPQEHYIAFYSTDGAHNQEVLLHDGAQWHVALSVDGGDPDIVTRAPNPMMRVEDAHSAAWSHDGWAVLELVLR